VIGTQGRTASYGQLADAAARLRSQGCSLKDAKDFRLIGKSLPRLDTAGKWTAARIWLDVQLPGMLYAAIAMSPRWVARPPRSTPPRPGAPWRAACSAHCQRSGGRGGTLLAAKKARDALRIDWEAGPIQPSTMRDVSLLNKAAAANPGASALSSDDVAAALKGGNAAEALKKAAKTFSAVYELPLVAHVTMEPMNCTAMSKRTIAMCTSVPGAAIDADPRRPLRG